MTRTRKKFKVDDARPGQKNIEMVGERFGMLVVESYQGLNKSKNKVWVCKCDCGNITTATTTSLRQGKVTSCKCNQYKSGAGVYNYTGYEDITGARWYVIKDGAYKRGYEFEITKEMVWELWKKQEGRCSFTGLPITFKDSSASVDRIDNSKGYTLDNITLVHKDINLMRNKFSVEYFKEMCKRVVENVVV